jgi:hypothetical protein
VDNKGHEVQTEWHNDANTKSKILSIPMGHATDRLAHVHINGKVAEKTKLKRCSLSSPEVSGTTIQGSDSRKVSHQTFCSDLSFAINQPQRPKNEDSTNLT